MPLGLPHLLSAHTSGTQVSHYLDGQTNGTGVATQPLADNGDPLLIGSRSDLVTKLKGDLWEVLLFGAAISDADRVALDDFLAGKYGLPLGGLPRISIVLNSPDTLLLSWPVSNLDFVLESAPSLTGGWSAVTNTVTTLNGINSVTVNTSGNAQLYRLHKE